MKRIGDLNYEFLLGSCGTYNFPEERVLLCFANKYSSKCERLSFSDRVDFLSNLLSYDGDIFHNQADSKNSHYAIALANIDNTPLAVGGAYSNDGGINTNKAEIFDISSNTWTEIADYPFHDL